VRQASQIDGKVFMSTLSSDFDQSVWEIVGLSAYEPKQLPDWLRDKLEGWWYPPELTPDEEVVRHQFAHLGIGEWGTAVINHQEAFIETQAAQLLGLSPIHRCSSGQQLVDAGSCIRQEWASQSLRACETRLENLRKQSASLRWRPESVRTGGGFAPPDNARSAMRCSFGS
jgi:hypothetical protein